MAVSTTNKWRIGALLAVCLGLVYYRFNPADHFFPRCPFLLLTGLKCPGCGSQRALHQLLHLHISGALQANFLLVVSIPYLIAGFFIQYQPYSPSRAIARRTWYGYRASLVVFGIVMAFWIGRNVFGF